VIATGSEDGTLTISKVLVFNKTLSLLYNTRGREIQLHEIYAAREHMVSL